VNCGSIATAFASGSTALGQSPVFAYSLPIEKRSSALS